MILVLRMMKCPAYYSIMRQGGQFLGRWLSVEKSQEWLTSVGKSQEVEQERDRANDQM